MSDSKTPITDNEEMHIHDAKGGMVVYSTICRQLETELGEAVDWVDGIRLGKYFSNGAMVEIFLKKHGRIK